MKISVQMMLVMEFVGGGNLAKNLSTDKTEPRKLGWYRNGRFVLLGVARGLAFMHSRNVSPDCQTILWHATGLICAETKSMLSAKLIPEPSHEDVLR